MMVCVVLAFFPINRLSAQAPVKDPNWIYDTSVKGVQFYHSIVDCNGKKVVFLKFNNQNNNPVEVSWKEVFTTQALNKQEGFLGQKKLTLSKGETFASDCAEITHRNCLILPRDVSPAYAVVISKFEFKDIVVSSN